MKKIYLSTIAFNDNIKDTYNSCLNLNIGIEFSSGIQYNSENINTFKRTKGPKLSHNYFPAPKTDFVLNLASKNEIIRKKSIDHCIFNLELCYEEQTDFYAAHAGFCLDPNPNQLGKKISSSSSSSKEKHFDIFLKSVNEIILHAKKLDIIFLIENNVLSNENWIANKARNPFLCCSSDEIVKLFESIDSNNFGLLLDTAHLKVSSKSLSLNLDEEYVKIKKYIKAIHHSDNEGLEDTNSILSKKYWFLDYMTNHYDLPNVIEVKNLSIEQLKTQLDLLKLNY